MPTITRSRRSADDANTPKKRRKVEQVEDAGSVLRDVELGERSKDLWFEDGSVILIAEQLSFRVHKSLLALRSDVFKTLLDDAASEQPPETAEGCLILRVEDRGQDLHDLLHIVYNGVNSDWHSSSRPPIEYPDFRRVVDIALKYNVKEVLEEARFRLSRVFLTDSLNKWDWELRPDGDKTPLQLDRRDCIDVLRISKLLGMHSIIPLVFYACCNIDPFEDIARGVELEGIPGRVLLSQEDLITCLRGREALLAESSCMMGFFQELASDSDSGAPKCATHAHCREALLRLSLHAVDERLYCKPDTIDPMDRWLDTYEAKLDAKPCALCDAVLRGVLDERREEIWRKLGDIFGVPEWPPGQRV